MAEPDCPAAVTAIADAWLACGTMRASSLSSTTSISRLCQTLGVSARTLRHYEALGLVTARRGTRGERVFAADQCLRAGLIVSLRQADIPIVEIRGVLDQERSVRQTASYALLEEQAKKLTARLEAVHAMQRAFVTCDKLETLNSASAGGS